MATGATASGASRPSGGERESEVRVALVGYGLGGRAFHAPLIATTPGMTLSGVVTSDPARAAAVRRRYPGCRVLARPEDVFADPSVWDLVVVSTPNATHVPLATAAAEAGLPCVVDKPVAPDATTARALERVASARGVLVVPFLNRRWDGDFLTVVELIRAGRLGSVHRFESRFERWRPAGPAAGGWRDDPDPAAVGGVLMDLGPHLVDQALVAWGRPTAVYAEVDRRRTGVEVDDDAFVALSWPDGRRAHLWAGSVVARPGPRFRVLGDRSGYDKWGMDPQEDALRAGRSPTEPGWGTEPRGAWGRLGEEGLVVETRPGNYGAFYAGLVATLRAAAPPPVEWADAVTGLEVLDAARVSAASGQVVDLG